MQPFDLVDHGLILQKLKIYGLQEDFLQWVECYLNNRHQAVWIDHIYSEFLHCKVGVPQGSILGPLLFIIFFNDLPDNIENSADCYADDTTVTASYKQIEDIEVKLNEDCRSIGTWMQSNRLKLNAEKTHVLTMGTSARLSSIRKPLEIKLNGVTLEQDPLKTEKLLGCFVQGDLKWVKQVSNLISTLKKRLAGLCHLR